MFKESNFGLNDNHIQMIFYSFDKIILLKSIMNKFLRIIRGEMNDFRLNLVNKVFIFMDINGKF